MVLYTRVYLGFLYTKQELWLLCVAEKYTRSDLFNTLYAGNCLNNISKYGSYVTESTICYDVDPFRKSIFTR